MILYFTLTPPSYGGEFSVSDFTETIENTNFHTDKNYGTITDYESAASAAKAAITERFDWSDSTAADWKGCIVKYDKANDAYLVDTYDISALPKFGGGHIVIIKSDGTVLAIWGEK